MEEEKPSIQFGRLIRYLITGITIAAMGLILWYFKTITLYLVFGVIFALIGRPIMNFLERVKIRKRVLPDGIKAVVALFAIWIVVAGFLALLLPVIVKEGKKLSQIEPDRLRMGLKGPVDDAVNFLEKYGLFEYILSDTSLVPAKPVLPFEDVDVPYPVIDTVKLDDSTIIFMHEKVIGDGDSLAMDSVKEFMADATVDSSALSGIKDSVRHSYHREMFTKLIEKKFRDFFNFQKLTGAFSSIFNVLADVFVAVFSITFIAFFFLKDKYLFSNIVLAFTPERFRKKAITVMNESRKMLSRYFIGLGVELLGVMIMTMIGLLIIGFEFRIAITIGFFCGFFNIIPYLGPVIGGVVGIILGITTHIDMDVQTEFFPLILKLVAVFSVTQFIDNWFLQPLIFSNSVNAHPLEIFIVILLAGTLAGIPGMIFAVPAYSFLRIIARQFFNHFKFVRSLTKNM